jgi:hypothetical protein
VHFSFNITVVSEQLVYSSSETRKLPPLITFIVVCATLMHPNSNVMETKTVMFLSSENYSMHYVFAVNGTNVYLVHLRSSLIKINYVTRS